MSVTVRDIAVAAGVSPGTASRALRGHPLISEVCITRVRQVAEALGYRPLRDGRIAADALIAAGHTRLAIVNPKADHTMFAVREHGFREAAAERSATMASFTTGSCCWRVPTAAGFAEECLTHFGGVPMIPPGMVGDAMGTTSLSTDDRWWIVVENGRIRRVTGFPAWHPMVRRDGRSCVTDTKHPDRGLFTFDPSADPESPVTQLAESLSSNAGDHWNTDHCPYDDGPVTVHAPSTPTRIRPFPPTAHGWCSRATERASPRCMKSSLAEARELMGA